MLNSTCTLPQPLFLDIFAHIVFILSIPIYAIALWVLCSRCPQHFRKYRNLLVIHVLACLAMELHMSIIWKMVGAVPWAAICAQGLAAEYAVQCFQVFVVILIITALSVVNLFKHRMQVVALKMEMLQKIERVFEALSYPFSGLLIVFTLASFPELRYQNEHKKLVEQKFGGPGSTPPFIWCDNCFFLRFDSPFCILFFISAYATSVAIVSQVILAIIVAYRSLMSTSCKLSGKTKALQKNFLNSLFIMMAVHVLFMIVPVLLFFLAHVVPFPNSIMAVSYLMVLLMQEHGTASTIAMLLTNKLLLETIRKKFICIVPRKISQIDTVMDLTE